MSQLQPLIVVPEGTPAYAKVIMPLDVVKETPDAICVSRNRWAKAARTAWLPKSQIVRMAVGQDDARDERVKMPLWLWARLRQNLLEDGEQ